MKILAEISVGELYDKITILNIKLKKIHDPNKLENIKIELNALLEQSNKIVIKDDKILKKYIQINGVKNFNNILVTIIRYIFFIKNRFISFKS